MTTKTYSKGFYWVRYCDDDGAKGTWQIAEFMNPWWSVLASGYEYESDIEMSSDGYELGPKLTPPPENYSENAE